ncbi:hypothetical protein GGR53DRAFT_529069 [Hypoxylon sp. FL1150]|nr:hypothetical protein GGR53DRAFT_529069 [Hypoxylon sp. FL1150]
MEAPPVGTGIVVDFDDTSHPNYAKTALNSESSLFKKLPIDVRLQIWELAVYIPLTISPYQKGSGSNKFTRGNRHMDGLFSDDYHEHKKMGTPTAVLLAQTCRHIYAELEAFAPFYKVNHFAFRSGNNLQCYLSAITTRRRQAIRHIELRSRSWYGRRGDFSLHQLRFFKDRKVQNDEVLALLTQCEGLKSGEITLDFNCNNDTAVDELIRRRARIGTDTPAWFAGLENPVVIQNAIGNAGVDFPGDDRVHLDRFNSFVGPVSSRTRHRCQGRPDELGSIEPPSQPKYDAEGYLITDNYMWEIRWVESRSNIECRMGNWRGPGVGDSWEPLYSIDDYRYEVGVDRCLRKIIKAPIPAKDKLEKMRTGPTPNDIIRIGRQYGRYRVKGSDLAHEFELLGPAQLRWLDKSAERRFDFWVKLMQDWNTCLARTEKRVGIDERKALRIAKKTAKLAAVAERRAMRAAARVAKAAAKEERAKVRAEDKEERARAKAEKQRAMTRERTAKGKARAKRSLRSVAK